MSWVPDRIEYGDIPSEPRNDSEIRRGDQVRALEGRSPDQSQTGIVTQLKRWGRAVVLWVPVWNEDPEETTVPTSTLKRIEP